LKIANPAEDRAVAEMQIEALLHIARADPALCVPRVCRTVDGAPVAAVPGPAGKTCTVRLLTFLEGITREAQQFDPSALHSLGVYAARLGRALRGFFHPAAGRTLIWDVQRAAALAPLLESVDDAARRALAERAIEQFARRVEPSLAHLRAQVIHGDVQADNVVLRAEDPSQVGGVIDFGDLVHAPLVCDLAVTSACMSWGRADPFEAAEAVIRGYASLTPLEPAEKELLPDLVRARLVAWVLVAAWRSRSHPANRAYIVNSTPEAWELLEAFERLGYAELQRRFREFGSGGARQKAKGTSEQLRARRRKALGPTLHLAYQRPLHLVRGEGVWLYDNEGRAYLDAYNNVPVVGHSHPRVTEALSRQASELNTNTRYLHPVLVELAERLVATMPPGLDTCFFVNSGSEANDVAWRLAREATGSVGAIVSEGAYHGVTVASADLSPAEWPSGRQPPQVATIPAPDGYRGQYREEPGGWATRCGASMREALAFLRGGGFEAAICCIDSCFASDGIFVPPPDFMPEVVRQTRGAGGLFVADEVQAGFGRTGRDFWGFDAAGIAPDLVTLGKPMGNGHPVAALVTRAEIAAAFSARYPEFFSTFGGNTVAAVAAHAVLDVIEDEGLQKSASEVGLYLQEGLRGLAARHRSIGEVRGAGLLIGVDLVHDRQTREPGGKEADTVTNAMRDRGVLVGTCGRGGNVLKIRPPLVFSRANADLLIEVLADALTLLER
jgi:4-aminobutyrate aminotransferase-like enzyme/Ser/Thr protein kinase RdoA (MazF antagonist)